MNIPLPPEQQAAASRAGTLDGAAVLARYARHWHWFGLGVLLALLLAFLFLRYATPKYSVTSKLLIRGVEKDAYRPAATSGLQGLDALNASTTIENETEVLKARHLIWQVMAEAALNVSYFRPGTVHDVEIYGPRVPVVVVPRTVSPGAEKQPFTLYLGNDNAYELADAGAARSQHRFGEEVRKPYGTFTVVRAAATDSLPLPGPVIVRLHVPVDISEAYSKNLTMETTNKKSSVLEITLLEAVPAKGEAFMHKLIEVYNRENKEDRNSLAVTTIKFIDERLETLSRELSAVERRVEHYKSENSVTNVTTEAAIYGEEAKNTSKQLAETTIQMDVLASLGRYLSKPDNKHNLVPSNLGTPDPTLNTLIGKFHELQLERRRMLRTAEASNPLVANMDEQLNNLRTNIQENLRTIAAGLTITRDAIIGNWKKADASIRQIPTFERKLLSISRQQGVKQSLYQFLLQKREEAALALAATGSNTRLLDSALVSLEPVKPSKPLVYLLALAAGLLLPLGFVSLRDLLGDRVDSRAVVRQHTAVPVLGEVPHLRRGQRLPVAGNAPGAATEAFHFLRNSLLLRLANGPSQVLLVSAGRPNQGQTLVALNLAASLGTVGKKVVVLDCNLRAPHLGRYVPPVAAAGVSSYLAASTLSVNSLCHDGGLGPDVQWIGAGPLPPNPAAALASPRVAELFAALKSEFDHIIVLTTPVGQAADALSLAPYVDACLFVVRLNEARTADLCVAEDILVEGKLANPLLVLNDVPA